MPEEQILFLAGDPSVYGSGHLRRCEILASILLAKGFRSSVQLFQPKRLYDIPVSLDAIILDARDEPFPEINAKIKKICLDNRGAGRSQADVIMDTLPHFDMSEQELKESLNSVILPADILQEKNKVEQAGLKKISLVKAEKEKSNVFSPLFSENRLARERYLTALKNSHTVRLYFGQSMFEAIYLGKQIELYPVSQYHARLTDWFIANWQNLSSPGQWFDGRGAERVIEKILLALQKESG